MRMQTKEQHAQSIALGRVEHAEKFAAPKKNKTSDVVQCVEKPDGAETRTNPTINNAQVLFTLLSNR